MRQRGWASGRARSSALIVVSVLSLLAGCQARPHTQDRSPGSTHTRSSSAARAKPSANARPKLPWGGSAIFPRYRVVAYYGTAGTTSLGVLGAGSPQHAAKRLQTTANRFANGGRPVLPAMELITTVADQSPGPDGTYSHRLTTGQARSYLHAARAHHQMLILDIQPGRSDFLNQLRPWWSLLAEPDVGLALDSEWRMPRGATPGTRIGHVDAREVNAVSARLARFVRTHRLPQKLFLIHQFTASMVSHVNKIAPHRELAMVQHLDGFGARAEKLAKYRRLQRPDRFHLGFKLFYRQDTDLISPTEVLKLHPPPEYISYQ